jgi:hypothetical protein
MAHFLRAFERPGSTAVQFVRCDPRDRRMSYSLVRQRLCRRTCRSPRCWPRHLLRLFLRHTRRRRAGRLPAMPSLPRRDGTGKPCVERNCNDSLNRHSPKVATSAELKVRYWELRGKHVFFLSFTCFDPKPTVGRFTDDRLRIRLRGSERLSDARKRCSRTCVHAETEVLSLQSIPPDRDPPSTVRVAFKRAALRPSGLERRRSNVEFYG